MDENIIYDNTHKNITRQNLKDIFLFQTQGVHIIIVNNDKMLKLRKGKDMKQINRAAAQITLLAAAILMIGYGAMRGEAATVLSKAIKLCMECVGIG